MIKARLHSKYHLTPTEICIAIAIGRGHTLREIAQARGIAIDTARAHLKHVFRKTDTHRQAELVLFIGRLKHSTKRSTLSPEAI